MRTDDFFKVLLVEDEEVIVRLLERILAGSPSDGPDFPVFRLQRAASLSEGLERLAAGGFDAVLLDLTLPDSRGFETFSRLHGGFPEVPAIILTGLDDEKLAVKAVRAGARDYLVKVHMTPSRLVLSILNAVERQRQYLETKSLAQNLQESESRLRVLNGELHKANQELRELNRLKSNFVATVSHDLRTPLTVISSIADNLLDGALGPLTKEQALWVGKIENRSIRLNEMITSILDLSKLESGTSELRLQRVDLSGLIRSLLSQIELLAKAKGIALTHDLRETLPSIWADPGMLEQVLTNLIHNALKFTPPRGTVHVSARQDQAFVQVIVSDSGPGIAPEYHDAIFERFRQIREDVESGASGKGIGLGLAICRGIISQHCGRIWVESQPGKGSNFIFQIPLEVQPPDAGSGPILIVHGDRGAREALANSLSAKGFEVAAFEDPQRALPWVQEEGGRLGLALLDAALAAGAETLTQAIRTAKPGAPVVFLSVRSKDIPAGSKSPTVILPKPFKLQQVLGMLNDLVPAFQSASIEDDGDLWTPSAAEPPSLETRKILIVDDDEDIRASIELALRLRNFRVESLSRGDQVEAQLRQSPPDLIIMDAILPGIDGCRLCRELKSSGGAKGIPILMLSAKAQREDIEKGLNAGADRYMTKPFKNEDLLEAIGDLLAGKSERRPRETGTLAGH
ncbi:MAG: hypothetical protein A3G41_08730 [Elusimicrobia bacterium RIFCSPLOWO2_12_FULL_59_9]|nr:MAG: hypothetical protein A3G41_08730 [Elusimicrobia bacterium RIFCSPLOWO2_12_FULL_59_9]